MPAAVLVPRRRSRPRSRAPGRRGGRPRRARCGRCDRARAAWVTWSSTAGVGPGGVGLPAVGTPLPRWEAVGAADSTSPVAVVNRREECLHSAPGGHSLLVGRPGGYLTVGSSSLSVIDHSRPPALAPSTRCPICSSVSVCWAPLGRPISNVWPISACRGAKGTKVGMVDFGAHTLTLLVNRLKLHADLVQPSPIAAPSSASVTGPPSQPRS